MGSPTTRPRFERRKGARTGAQKQRASRTLSHLGTHVNLATQQEKYWKKKEDMYM